MAWDSDYRYEPFPLFEQTFECLPFSSYKKPHLETGDKIVLPPSSLDRLLALPIDGPYMFKIECFGSDRISHCGVLEFDSDEGFVYMPEWMMKNLKLRSGELVVLRNAKLKRGIYMKLQPHTTSFVELSNPRAVLETTMRGFTCLSRGDTFMIKHGGRDFYFDVLDLGVTDAISLIDCDCQVEFAAPLDHKEPESEEEKVKEKADCEKEEEGKAFSPFTGKAVRLDGKAVAVEGRSEEGKKGKKDGGKGEFKPFTGRGRVLRGI